VIDLHCHILPGLDDGPRNMDDSLALARASVDAGVHTVVATTHVSPRYRNRPELVRVAARHLDVTLRSHEIPLRVLPGAEIALSVLSDLTDDDLHQLRLGEGRFLLLESPLNAATGDVTPLILSALQRGFRVVLAHPERSPHFQHDRNGLHRLAAGGVLMSVTAGAFAGVFGKPPRQLAGWMLREGLVHNLCSDMHDLGKRVPGIAGPVAHSGELRRLLEPQLPWLCEAMPQAVVDGAPLPPMPRVPGVGEPARARWRPWGKR
jgi:protein-tyrosine phosphatase